MAQKARKFEIQRIFRLCQEAYARRHKVMPDEKIVKEEQQEQENTEVEDY